MRSSSIYEVTNHLHGKLKENKHIKHIARSTSTQVEEVQDLLRDLEYFTFQFFLHRSQLLRSHSILFLFSDFCSKHITWQIDRELASHWIYQRERFIKADFPTHCSYGPVNFEDPFKWQGVVMGPPGSPYEDGVFCLSIELPDDYPTRPPIIKFLTKIYHPNIDNDGNIYIDILEENQWNPIQNIESLLLSICSLLNDPNPVDPLNPSSNIFKTNIQEFNRTAREWTKNYASDMCI